MSKTTNDYMAIYKSQLDKGDIQVAYKRLFEIMGTLKAYFNKEAKEQFSFGNIMPGYMDYSYFYFFDEYLRSKKLRFGLVFNHHRMCFELWLLGQNAEVQNVYWNQLKNTKWNKDKTEMPIYSVLEIVIEEAPDFDNPTDLCSQLYKSAMDESKEICSYLERACD